MPSSNIRELELNFITKYFNKIFNCTYNPTNLVEIFDEGEGPAGYLMTETKLLLINFFMQINGKEQKFLNKQLELAKENFEDVYMITVVATRKPQISFELNGKTVDQNKLIKDFKFDKQKEQKISELPHKIHQWMYDNSLQMDRVHKQILIAFILIGLKLRPIEIRKAEHASDIIEIIKNVIKIKYGNDQQFLREFDFLYAPGLIREHIKNIINLFPYELGNGDILNKFFSEFQTYQKNNEAERGIVLTPSDVVEMMVNELNLKPSDSVLDICTGTGSFLCKSVEKGCTDLRGCEIVNSEYVLVKCNFIINNLDCSRLKCNDCFNESFDNVDYAILNPPFNPKNVAYISECGTVFRSVEAFVVKALERCDKGACFVIPMTRFSENKCELKFKSWLMENFKINKLILLSDSVFKPNATVQCLIVSCTRNGEKGLKQEVDFVDYTNDGYGLVNKVRSKKEESKIIVSKKLITPECHWAKNDDEHDDAEVVINSMLENLYKNELVKLTDSFKLNN